MSKLRGAVGVDRFEMRGAEVSDGLVTDLVSLGPAGVDGVLQIPVVDRMQALTRSTWAW